MENWTRFKALRAHDSNLVYNSIYVLLDYVNMYVRLHWQDTTEYEAEE